MNICCQRFAEGAATAHDGGIQQDESGVWNVLGCCGDCYVLSDIRFCPFCGSLIEPQKAPENAAVPVRE